MYWQSEILEDGIVRLRPLIASDFDALFAVACDPLIWEQHPANDRYKEDVFRAYFDAAMLCKTAFVIIDLASNTIIGSSRYYDYDSEDYGIAIGFTFLGRDYWGGIYNASCKKLLLDYAFTKVKKVYFHVGATNYRSQKAIAKTGARKNREYLVGLTGKETIHFEYILQKEEWLGYIRVRLNSDLH